MIEPYHKHSSNYRGLNRFPDIPLHDWKAGTFPEEIEFKARGMKNWGGRKNYYFPKPIEDQPHRKRADLINENLKIVQYNDNSSRRPYISPLHQEGPFRMAESLIAKPSQAGRPRGHIIAHDKTKEQKTGLREPIHWNIATVPRQRSIPINNHDRTDRISEQPKYRAIDTTISLRDETGRNLQNMKKQIGRPVGLVANTHRIHAPIQRDDINLADKVRANPPRGDGPISVLHTRKDAPILVKKPIVPTKLKNFTADWRQTAPMRTAPSEKTREMVKYRSAPRPNFVHPEPRNAGEYFTNSNINMPNRIKRTVLA